MNGVFLVARREFMLQVRSKGFLISVLAMVLIVTASVLIPKLLTGEDFYRVALVGKSSERLGEPLAEIAESSGIRLSASVLADEDSARAGLDKGELDAAVVDGRTVISDGALEPGLSGLLQGANEALAIAAGLAQQGLTEAQISQAVNVLPLQELSISNEDSYASARQGIALLIMLSLLFLFMTTTVSVASGVVEEKGSRIVEILLVALKPWQLLTGKLIAFGALGLIQLTALAATGIVAASASGLMADIPPGIGQIVAVTFVAYVLGFLFFGAMAAALASLVSRQEETNGALAPLTAAIVLSYLAAFVVVSEPDLKISAVLTVLPPISSVALPVQIAAGTAQTWQVILAPILMVLAIVAIVALGGRIYERSVLRIGTRIKLMTAIRGQA